MPSSETSSVNPYQPTLLEEGGTRTFQRAVTPRWPTPILILGSAIVIGITVASTMTNDLGPRPGELNLALWAFVCLSLTFGAAGALFGYQYLLGHVPIWYSPVAMGFFAVASLSEYPNIDHMSMLICILAVANGIVATLTPWIAKRFFAAGLKVET